ncbi:MAG: hypothetical protein R3C15_13600 [Thermoleophilia bacterium]
MRVRRATLAAQLGVGIGVPVLLTEGLPASGLWWPVGAAIPALGDRVDAHAPSTPRAARGFQTGRRPAPPPRRRGS